MGRSGHERRMADARAHADGRGGVAAVNRGIAGLRRLPGDSRPVARVVDQECRQRVPCETSWASDWRRLMKGRTRVAAGPTDGRAIRRRGVAESFHDSLGCRRRDRRSPLTGGLGVIPTSPPMPVPTSRCGPSPPSGWPSSPAVASSCRRPTRRDGTPTEHTGMASGFRMTGHEVGAALGVAVLSAVAGTAGSLAGATGVVAAYGRGSLAVSAIAVGFATLAVVWMPSGGPRCTCTCTGRVTSRAQEERHQTSEVGRRCCGLRAKVSGGEACGLPAAGCQLSPWAAPDGVSRGVAGTGRVNSNTLPRPSGRSATVMTPPCRSTARRQMAKPSPVPR